MSAIVEGQSETPKTEVEGDIDINAMFDLSKKKKKKSKKVSSIQLLLYMALLFKLLIAIKWIFLFCCTVPHTRCLYTL